jgi:hypothetical protein
MAFPSIGPAAAYSIAYADVVDLARKNQICRSAPQHLSDCSRIADMAGQFLSAIRKAVRLNASG